MAYGRGPWRRGAAESVDGTKLGVRVRPQLFNDLTDRAPEQISVDFMTGTMPIEYRLNEDQLGEVLDYLLYPIMIPIEYDFENNEQLLPRVQGNQPDEAAELSTWLVDVS